MKKRFLYFLLLATGIVIGSYSVNQLHSQTPAQNNTEKQQTVKYTCPMHPELIKDKPGKCPICRMELVIKKDNPKNNMHQVHDSTMMNQDHMKMKHDSTSKEEDPLLHDTTSMKKK